MHLFRAAVLDVDYTLTTEDSMTLVNRELGVSTEEFVSLSRAALSGRITAQDSYNKLHALWTSSGRATRPHLTALFKSVPLRTDAAPFIAELQKRGMPVCLITGSTNLLAAATAARLGIAEHHSNIQLSFDRQGELANLTATLDAAGLKVQQFLDFCARHRLAPQEVLVVGDADNDKGLFTLTGNGVLLANGRNAHLSSWAWKEVATLHEITGLLPCPNTSPGTPEAPAARRPAECAHPARISPPHGESMKIQHLEGPTHTDRRTSHGTARPATTLLDHARTLLDGVGEGAVAPSSYTTAWAARLRQNGQPLFPAARRWLLDHQLPDGSWGGVIEMPHDRTISTLAALVALAEDGPGEPSMRQAVESGCTYLRAHAGDWRHHYAETCAFETIIPQLLNEARASGLQLPYQEFAELEEATAAKLRLIPRERLVSEPTSLLFSLEGIPELSSLAPELARFVTPNGALGNSIASTVVYHMATGDPQSLRFLQEMQDEEGGFPEYHPIEILQKLWVLHHLDQAGLLPDPGRYAPWLISVLGQTGLVSFSSSFPVPDSDDSAMALLLLHKFHPSYDTTSILQGLLAFETPSNFADYPYARQTSITPNARVLQALLKQPDRYGPQIEKALRYVIANQQAGGWWCDYWNVSPYYGTAHVLFALTSPGLEHEDVRECLDRARGWLIESRHRSGVWGFGDGTPEETAYAVLALDALADAGGAVPHHVWSHAAAYLHEHLNDPSHPELWIAKALYHPIPIVKSALLAGYAIALGRASDGCGPSAATPDAAPNH